MEEFPASKRTQNKIPHRYPTATPPSQKTTKTTKTTTTTTKPMHTDRYKNKTF